MSAGVQSGVSSAALPRRSSDAATRPCNEPRLLQWLMVNGVGCTATGLLRLGLSCRELCSDCAHRIGLVLAIGCMIFCTSWWLMGWLRRIQPGLGAGHARHACRGGRAGGSVDVVRCVKPGTASTAPETRPARSRNHVIQTEQDTVRTYRKEHCKQKTRPTTQRTWKRTLCKQLS